ncbi:MAG: hypothetical protein AB7J28_15435 [Hyphomonadaceae bacterium]
MSPNDGAMADAISKIGQAVQILQMALPQLPIGSEEHKAVMDMITKGSKVAPSDQIPQGVQMGTIAQLGADAEQSAMLQMLQKTLGAPAAAGAPAPAGPPGGLPGMM